MGSDSQGLFTTIVYFLSMAGWISALISSIFGAGEEVEKILEEE